MKENIQTLTAKDFELTAQYANKQYLIDNEEIEAKLAGIIINISDCQAQLFARLSHSMFAYPWTRMLFTRGEELYSRGKEINVMTIMEAIKQEGTEDDNKMLLFKLQEMQVNYFTDPMYVDNYILILQQYYTRRQAFVLMSNMLQKTQLPEEDPVDVLTETIDLCTRLMAATGGAQQLKQMPEVMKTVFEAFNLRKEQDGQGVTGVDMGIPAMNQLLMGWQPDYLYIIAAGTGIGKTAFMLHAALTAARLGKHVLIISLEMSALHLGDRLIGMTTTIPPEDWAKGKITAEQMQEAQTARADLEKIEIRLHDTGSISMQEVALTAKALHAQGLCDMVCIDYLQLFRGELQRNEIREQEVARNSRTAKQIAMRLHIPVLLLSQFNREVYNQKEQRPTLANLRESGSIEQDADVVMLLHRPAKADIPTDKKTGYPTDGLLINIVAKNRNGRTEDIYIAHSPAMNRFEDYEPPTEWIKKLKGGTKKSQFDLFMEKKKEGQQEIPD